MKSLFILIGIFLLCILFVAFNIVVGLAIISMGIVPLTWLYAKIVGQSYNFTIDQSEMLYKLNKFGQWSFVIGLCLLVAKFIL